MDQIFTNVSDNEFLSLLSVKALSSYSTADIDIPIRHILAILLSVWASEK